MAKKALVSTTELRGKDNSGYRVLEVVDTANTFDTHPNLEWKDCADTVEMDKYWFDPATTTFRKLPEAVAMNTAGELTVDAEGNPTERYVWDWDSETWSKEQL
jgi:pyridoxine/pyridoxamine 5'-phosphate oxidase